MFSTGVFSFVCFFFWGGGAAGVVLEWWCGTVAVFLQQQGDNRGGSGQNGVGVLNRAFRVFISVPRRSMVSTHP